MFGIQPIHIIIVAIVALVIFGPSRLPELGRSLGKSITEFRKGMREMTDGMREELQDPDQKPAPAPTQSVPANQTYTPPQPVQPVQTAYPPQPVQTIQSPAPPQISAGITCPNCGTANLPGARFCNQCGAGLVN